MKTLNLISIKKLGLGIITALIIGTSAFANNSTESENISAEEIEIMDSWMTDLSSWKSVKTSAFNVDIEEELELEYWMTNLNSEIWSSDREEEMVIEDWMNKGADLYKNTFETEEELTLEEWMIKPTTWIK